MHSVFLTYARWVDALNHRVGRFVMYVLLLALVAILSYDIIAPLFGSYPIWTLESAEYAMVAYFMLGGGYAILHEGHVRMDVFYSRWSKRVQALMDCITDLCLIFYLGVLLYGGINSTGYALIYGQHSQSAWSPPTAPIKIIMVIGIVLTLLQALSVLIKDLNSLLSGAENE